jgi:hypothetical protein
LAKPSTGINQKLRGSGSIFDLMTFIIIINFYKMFNVFKKQQLDGERAQTAREGKVRR